MHHVASMPAGLPGERAASLVCIPALSIVWQARSDLQLQIFSSALKTPNKILCSFDRECKISKGRAFPLRTPD